MRKLLVGLVALAACGGEGATGTGSNVQAVGSCTPLVLPAMIDGEWDAGEITVTSGAGDIVVSAAMQQGLYLGSLDVYAGPGPVPVDLTGSADLSRFSGHVVVDPPSATGEIHVPLADAGLACGDSLVLAIRAGVGFLDSSTGLLLGDQSGWAGSETGFTYQPCCGDDLGCTRAIGGWKHEPAWPVTSLDLGSTTYTEEDLRLVLETAPRGDGTVLLGHQAIVARLNVAAGAAAPADVQQALADADAWFDANGVVTIPGQIPAGSPAYREATLLLPLLARFNEGFAGVALCH